MRHLAGMFYTCFSLYTVVVRKGMEVQKVTVKDQEAMVVVLAKIELMHLGDSCKHDRPHIIVTSVLSGKTFFKMISF